MIKHAGEIEVLSYFQRRQSVKLVAHCTSTKKIAMAALYFSSTGSAQGKAYSAILVKPVSFVKKRRDLLHFVYDHLANG